MNVLSFPPTINAKLNDEGSRASKQNIIKFTVLIMNNRVKSNCLWLFKQHNFVAKNSGHCECWTNSLSWDSSKFPNDRQEETLLYYERQTEISM